jgi:tetratricopeptide (TPR) repeat protein
MNPRNWIAVGLLAVAIGAVYGPFVKVPFVYDDNAAIIANSSIRSIWPLIGPREHPGPLNPATDLPTSGRPLVNLSFAINYAYGGLNPTGYHAVNILIHFLTSLLIWTIVKRSLLLPYFEERYATSAGWFALIVAMLWAIHPLQTEAVIYATQRTELMVALFFVATLYCSLRYWQTFDDLSVGKDANRAIARGQAPPVARKVWLGCAVLASLAGMASKEVMVSAPLMILLFDRTFISGSLQKAIRRFWPLYVGLACTWLLLLMRNLNAPRGATAGLGLRISPWEWWLTQAKIFWIYLKLVVWPWPLLIYYELPPLQKFAEAWMYVLPAGLLVAATLVLLWRNQPAGYLLAWVFVILAPTSLVPIITEQAAERRMYLPLVAIVALLVIGAWRLLQSEPAKLPSSAKRTAAQDSRRRARRLLTAFVASAFVLTFLFGVVDAKHLQTYRDETNLWQEVIQHQPLNVTAHNNLADLLIHAGRPQEAIAVTKPFIALRPEQPIPYNNLGVALSAVGQHAEAAEYLRQGVRLRNDYAEAHSNLGLELTYTGHHEEALKELRQALSLQPNYTNAVFNIGIVFTNMGDSANAIEQYERAIQLQPDFVGAYINLGAVLSMAGRNAEAAEKFRRAVELDPKNVDAQNNLGLMLAGFGQTDEAIRHFEQALRMRPDRSDIYNNLGQALLRAGRTSEAVEQFQAAVRLKPDDIQSVFDLAQALARIGRRQEAIAAARQAITLAQAANLTDAARQFDGWLSQYQAQDAAR